MGFYTEHTTASLLDQGQVSEQEIIPAPGEGKQIVITDLDVSASTLVTAATIKSGSSVTNRRKYYLAINSTVARSFLRGWRMGENENCNLTTSGIGPTSVSCTYTIETL